MNIIMDLIELIKTRRSIRKFIDRPVEKDKILQILEAGRWAPSGGNRQPWRFIVVTDKEKMRKFDPYAHQPWVENATCMIVVCVNPFDTWERYDENDLCYIQDASAAIQNMLLMIHYLGLGGVWIATFSKKEVKKALKIPKHIQILAIIPFGYYKKGDTLKFFDAKFINAQNVSRKALKEISFFNEFGNPLDAYKND